VLNSLPALIRYLRREHPSVLFSAMGYVNVIAVWAKILSRGNFRLILSEHSTLSMNKVNARGFKSRFIPYLMAKSYPYADRIVAVSEGVADDLIREIGIDRKKVIVINNPVITPELFQKAEEHIDTNYFTNNETPIIIAVGRLGVEKSFDSLIKAFSLVRKQTKSRLLILGEGEQRTTLETLAKELDIQNDLSLPGFVSNPYKYLKDAAVFVLSSRWEGLPTVLIEALAVGISVVSTDCPSGPREILENGRWGRLVPVGNIKEMAQAIIDGLEGCIAKPPIELMKVRYGIDEITQKYLNVLFEERIIN
jgi:glycosyltransferase involved in cell wall biosynthesis